MSTAAVTVAFRPQTFRTLADWNTRPLPVLRGWLVGSTLLAFALLLGVAGSAELAAAGGVQAASTTLGTDPTFDAVWRLFLGNSAGLALHGMVCIGVFMAVNASRDAAGLTRLGGRIALACIAGALAFSVINQLVVLGDRAAAVAPTFGLAPAALLVHVLPHAALEMIATFLPLGALCTLWGGKRWEDLPAAAGTSVAFGLPLLGIAALIEVYVTPALPAFAG